MLRKLVHHLILAAGTAATGASGAAAQRVAITFDDLPVHSALPPGITRLQVAQQILRVIHDERLPPVTGMVNAVRVKEQPDTLEVLKAWRSAGQPLASHGYSHMNLLEHTAAEFEQDIVANEKVLAEMAKLPEGHPQQQDWHYFRYPNLQEGDGDKRLAVRSWLADHGYTVAEVTLEFNDYNWNQPYARCMAKGDAAALIRLHDSYLSVAKQQFGAFREEAKAVFGHEIPYVLLLHIGAFDAHMFPELVAMMKAGGFTFVTLPEAEKDPAYTPDLKAMKGGGPYQDQLAKARGITIPARENPEKELAAMCR